MELGIIWSPTWLEVARVKSSWLDFYQAQIFAYSGPRGFLNNPPRGNNRAAKRRDILLLLRATLHDVESSCTFRNGCSSLQPHSVTPRGAVFPERIRISL